VAITGIISAAQIIIAPKIPEVSSKQVPPESDEENDTERKSSTKVT